MAEVLKIETVRDYNAHIGAETLHPLVSVIPFREIPTVMSHRMSMEVYAMFLKDVKCGDMTYGCQPYDYEDGTLVFVAPGQLYGVDSQGKVIVPSGYALVFHPDLLHGTHLARQIKDYSFFSYEVNEALHLSKKERETIVDCLHKISTEIRQNIDSHSQRLIVSNIELLLNYCTRFYDRQFITRSRINKDILTRFEQLLDNYFRSGKAEIMGLPSVSWCADALNLSPNYFGDLIKKETAHTALYYIQSRLIDEAKRRMSEPNKTIHEISVDLGFKYQQHFTRLFKQRTGLTPMEFKKMGR